jgi:glycerate 2-kinase
MKILVASDSFKDALSALEVCKAIGQGIHKFNAEIEVILFPLGDGGEGTAEVLTWHAKGDWIKVQVRDPLLRIINAGYGTDKNDQIAFIEMAQASGLELLQEEERNCLYTSTYGTGELILDAVRRGAQHIIMGIGGSATNDIGIGMAAALGYRFFDQKNVIVHPVGESLKSIRTIDGTEVVDLNNCNFTILCDVDNPLLGPQGAAQTYARQKGADATAVEFLEQGAQHFSTVLTKHFGKGYADIKGAGAAGGLGAGALAFLNAKLCSGINFVLDYTDFEKALASADIVITGEGKIDEQTLHGKLIHGITQRAKKFNIPVIAFCGSLRVNQEQIEAIGLRDAFQISDPNLSLEEALSSTANNLEQTAYQVVSTKLSTYL